MKTIYIIPKFEWSSNGNLPVGFSQSIGIGYAGSSIVDKSYKKTETHITYTDSPATTNMSTVKGSSFAPIHGMVVEYGFKIRFPITSFMTFNLGSNLRIHLPGFRYMISGNDTSTLNGQIERSMRNSRGSNLMDIRAGLSLILF
jgi:hypothetical protein